MPTYVIEIPQWFPVKAKIFLKNETNVAQNSFYHLHVYRSLEPFFVT